VLTRSLESAELQGYHTPQNLLISLDTGQLQISMDTGQIRGYDFLVWCGSRGYDFPGTVQVLGAMICNCSGQWSYDLDLRQVQGL